MSVSGLCGGCVVWVLQEIRDMQPSAAELALSYPSLPFSTFYIFTLGTSHPGGIQLGLTEDQAPLSRKSISRISSNGCPDQRHFVVVAEYTSQWLFILLRERKS